MRLLSSPLHLALVLFTLAASAISLSAAPVAPKVNASKLSTAKGVIVCPPPGALNAKASEVMQMLPVCVPSNTRLQVLRDEGPEFKYWLDRYDLHWRASDQNKNLTFRWSTEAQGVTAAVWQVTIHRYNIDVKKWETPSGIVTSGKLTQVPKAGGSVQFDIDFSKFAPKPGAVKPILPVSSKKPDIYILESVTEPIIAKLKLTTSTPAGTATRNNPGQVKAKPHPPTAMHVVYYVRVIPVNSKGQRVGLPSSAVEIGYGDPPPQPYVDMTVADQTLNGHSDPNYPANLPELNHPDIKILFYAAIQKDQPGNIYRYIVTSNCPAFFGVLKPGTELDFTPHKNDDDWWDAIGGFFSDVFSFAADAVNWVSTAYNDIKTFAISWAPDDLKGYLSTGLDIGLAAMGIPPSIPSFDELTSMGTDYMIKAAADYAGVDPDLAKTAVGEFMKATSSQASCGGNPAVWLRPNPKFYYRPAYMMIKVTNNTNKSTDQVTANVMAEPVGDKDAQEHGETMFYTTSTFVPRLQPGESVSIPVCFEECMPLRWDDHDLQAGIHRFWMRYNSRPVKFSVSTYNGGKYKNRWKVQQTLELEHAYYGYTAQ